MILRDKDVKKILIITYYWPPSGGAGVQRWLKTSKYLSRIGWEPVVYTPENPEAPAQDNSLLKEITPSTIVLKRKIWEPYSLYNKLTGKKKTNHSNYLSADSKKSIFQKFSEYIRANWFIPDPRKFWIRPSVNFLTKYINKNDISAIITTGPPHSMHLIGLKLKQKTNIPWIADFRDPWTFIDFFHLLPISKKTLKKHSRLEERVIKNANACVTVSPSWKKEFEKLYGIDFELIYNGYDVEDFPPRSPNLDTSFSICHIGSLNEDRNPKFLWETLNQICKENTEFKNDLSIKLIGATNPLTIQQLSELDLVKNLIKIEYLNHNEVINETCKSQILLLLINNTANVSGIIPGKIYEYLAAQRPILCIGNPKADAAQIIDSTQSGVVINFNDKILLRESILKYYQEFKSGKIECSIKSNTHFTREYQANQFSKLITRITNE